MTYTPWQCAVCGESGSLGGGIIRQMSETRAIAGRCGWCEVTRCLVVRRQQPALEALREQGAAGAALADIFKPVLLKKP